MTAVGALEQTLHYDASDIGFLLAFPSSCLGYR